MDSGMTKVIVYIATSQDGYIADEKGSVDWLPQTEEETGGEDFGYHGFYNSIDAIAIGRKTYDQILGFGDWPYPGKISYIFSRFPQETENPDIKFVSESISDFMNTIEKKKVSNLWMVGGSELIEAFYDNNFIDEFIVTVFPKVLKAGIPFKTLNNALMADKLIKEKSIDYGSGIFQAHYKLK
jgi:dihydrofolate reductase